MSFMMPVGNGRYVKKADDGKDIFNVLEQMYLDIERDRGSHETAQAHMNRIKPELEQEEADPQKSLCNGGRYTEMTDEQLGLIVMIDVNGYTYRDVAIALDTYPVTIQRRHNRARAKLISLSCMYDDWIDENGIDIDSWTAEVGA